MAFYLRIKNHYRYFLATLVFILIYSNASSLTIKKDTAQVYVLLQKAKDMAVLNKKDSAEVYFEKSGALAQKLNFDNGFLQYTGDYTNFLYTELRYKEALKIAEKQLKKSLTIGNKKTLANAYNNIGLLYYNMSMMTKAVEYYMNALKISESSKDLFNQRKYNSNLASLFIDIKDYKKGYKYALKGYQIAMQLKDSTTIARSLANLVVVEVHLQKYQEAIVHSKKLIEISKKNEDHDTMTTGLINLGDIYNRQGKYEQSMQVLKLAENNLKNASPGYDAYVYHSLASSARALGNYTLANTYFEKTIINAAQVMPLADLKGVYLLGSELKETSKDFKNALKFSQLHQKINDSLEDISNRQAIHDAETKYQTSVKERKIAEQHLEIAKHNNEINKKNNVILLTSLIILVLVAFGTIIFISYRQKNRALLMEQEVKLLEALLAGEERERQRTARELHDAVASTLSAAKLQLHLFHQFGVQNFDENKTKTLALIDTAVKEIRNISHNMAPNHLLEEGLFYATENFCNSVSNNQLQITSYFIGELPKLNAEHALLIYRVVQEAVNNIIKHAQATEAVVQLTTTSTHLDITIEDNGRGFEIDKIDNKGIGISNLNNRIKLLNGSFELQSRIGEGTNIYINIPLQLITRLTTDNYLTFS
ncbi:tetratricopeptide repeat protein [Pedobacter sp. UBA4863]|uniref:tetratricopeptide repeat-containing sensor histidine kinase n=1 Tax=Pedobacter sp. UBA4863 TaxID=1947060 RepID=UPI0025EB0946|nr:tetratricopeptide repeat protein [Pedobacter sp. UBA4863]